jgi:hypothetical protein
MIPRNRLANHVPSMLALAIALPQGGAHGQSAPDALGIMPNNVGVYFSGSTTDSVSNLEEVDTDAAKDGEFVQSTAGKYWFKRKVPASPAGASPLDEIDLFLKDAQGQWNYVSTLLPPPSAGGSSGFGTCVVSRGNRVFIGAPGALNGSSVASGVVYVYDLNDTNLTLVQTIEPPNGAAGDRFGEAISVHGSRLIVGAPGREKDDSGSIINDAGAAFLYEEGTNWQLLRTEWSTVAQDGGQFGFSVSVNGRLLAIGAPYEDGWFFVGNDVYVMGDTGTVHIGRWDRPGELLGFYNLFSLFQPVQDKILGLDGAHFGWSVAVDDRMRIAVSMPDTSWTAADGMSGWDSGLVMMMYWNGLMDSGYSFQINGFWQDGLSAASRFGEYVETSDGILDFGIQCAQRVDNAPLHWFAKTTVQAQPGSLVNGVDTPLPFGILTGMDPDGDPVNHWSPSVGEMYGSYFNIGEGDEISAKSNLATLVTGLHALHLRGDDGGGGILSSTLTLEILNGAADTDGDGLPDSWETTYGLNPNNPDDAGSDLDVDGLTALKEYQTGNNPTKDDTNGNGVVDGLENTYAGSEAFVGYEYDDNGRLISSSQENFTLDEEGNIQSAQ